MSADCGIYSITCGEKNRHYIGQSMSMTKRKYNHKTLLIRDKHYNSKLQEGYNKYKIFTFDVLEYIQDYKLLNDREIHYINLLDATNTGYNITGGGQAGYGCKHSAAIYSENQIIEALLLGTNPDITYQQIADKLHMSYSAVKGVINRETHAWLDNLFPDEIQELLIIKNTRKRLSKKHVEYKFSSMKDPEGNIHKVDNIAEFARIHNLHATGIRNTLLGSQKTHLGWSAI